MNNVYFLAWRFNGVFGVSYTKFKTLEDLNVWKDKYNVKINAVHEYRNKHLYSIIFEDERAKTERIKAENEKERRKLRQDLYIDFVNGHKYF